MLGTRSGRSSAPTNGRPREYAAEPESLPESSKPNERTCHIPKRAARIAPNHRARMRACWHSTSGGQPHFERLLLRHVPPDEPDRHGRATPQLHGDLMGYCSS